MRRSILPPGNIVPPPDACLLRIRARLKNTHVRADRNLNWEILPEREAPTDTSPTATTPPAGSSDGLRSYEGFEGFSSRELCQSRKARKADRSGF